MVIFLKKNLKPLLFVLVIFSLYAFMAPISVQSGDTGELVTNSFFLRVSHPPGYPLWSLLYHIPVKYFNFGNPFHSASIFTTFISVLAIACIGLVLNLRAIWFILAVLSTTAVIWKQALLPDVFALHMFFLSLVFICFSQPELLNRWWMILMVALSVAHHHTIVFVFPMFLYALIESKPTSKKITTCLLAGVFSLSLYLLLLVFNPDDYGSWGNIHSFSDVLHHFLRKDYGTFNLMTSKGEGISWISFFLEHSLLDMWSLWILLGYFALKHQDLLKVSKAKIATMLICLFLYFMVFGLQDVSLAGESEAVIERFLLQPLLLIAFLAIFLVYEFRKDIPKALLIMIFMNAGLNVWTNFNYLNFREKTGTEDYIKNSLKKLPSQSAVFTRGDSFSFGTYYLINVMNFRPDIKQIHANWEFKWSQDKARKAYPDLFKAYSHSSLIFELIDLEKFPFYTNFSANILPADVGISYEGLLYRFYLRETHNFPLFSCRDNYDRRMARDMRNFSRFETNAYFEQVYGECDFSSGLYHLKGGNLDSALSSFRKAVELSPFNARYQERLCFVLHELKRPEAQSCQQQLDLLILNTSEQYYLNKYSL